MQTYTYTVLYQPFPDGETTGYIASVPALPGCSTWGETLDEAKEMAADAIRCYVESLKKENGPVPDESNGMAGPHLE